MLPYTHVVYRRDSFSCSHNKHGTGTHSNAATHVPSSCRLLNSLGEFTDLLQLNGTPGAIFTEENFALSIKDVDVSEFVTESFVVNLGSAEQAIDGTLNSSSSLMTVPTPNTSATASLTVSQEVFGGSTDKMQRLSYSLFLSGSLFPLSSCNQSVACNQSLASIIVAVRVKNYSDVNADSQESPPINISFLVPEPVSDQQSMHLSPHSSDLKFFVCYRTHRMKT